MRPIKPTDILFSSPSSSFSTVAASALQNNSGNNKTNAGSGGRAASRGEAPQNLYIDPSKVHNVSAKLSKKNKQSKSSVFVPSKDTNMLVPEIVDPPVIESAAFKAYLILSENNIFLQSELDRSNRRRRRNLLQGNLNQNDTPVTDQHLNNLAESGFLEDSNENDENNNNDSGSATNNDDNFDDENDVDNDCPPAMIRGLLLFRVLKPNTKIKNISLNFKGDTRTNWPEGIPPKKTEFMEIENILNYNWNLFDVHNHLASNYYRGGADHINTLPDNFMLDMDNLDLNDSASSLANSNGNSSISPSNFFSTLTSVTSGSVSKKKSKFSIVKFGSKNSNANSNNSLAPSVSSANNNTENLIASSGYDDLYLDSSNNYIFQPGDYIYTFEKEIPNNVPETASFTFGFVNYWLNLEIGRQAKFKGTLRAKTKVNLIRSNTMQSIEDNYEPIVINKTWENRLDYSILIASSQIVLNSFVPINIKLTPLDKNLKVYKIKIFLIEILEYWCKNRKVHRLEPQRKFLLLEHKPQRGTNLLRDDISDVNANNDNNHHNTYAPDSANSGSHTGSFRHNHINPSGDNSGSDNEYHTDSEDNHNRRKSNSKKSHNNNNNNNHNTKKVLEDDENEYISSKDFSYQLYVPEKFTKFSSKLHSTVKHKNIQSHHWIKIAVRLSKLIDDFDVVDDSGLENVESNNNSNNNSNGSFQNNGHAHNGASSLISSAIPRRKTNDTGSNNNSGNNPSSKPKRKHYEISIDSPITLVHPLCTQANTLLPVYEGIGDFNPYTFARTKQSGEVDLITDNNPLFPPEILTDNAVPEYQPSNTTHKTHIGGVVGGVVGGVAGSHPRNSIGSSSLPNGGLMSHNILDLNSDMQSVKSNSSNSNINNLADFPALENTRRDSSMDSGMEQFNHIDHEFEAEITPDMFRANLYTPRSIQLDLTTIQAQPRNSHLNPADIVDDGKKQLSPNFRALSPTLKGLRNLPSTSTSADLINNDNHHPRISSKGIHILEKPSIIPPSYEQAKNDGDATHLPNTKLNHLLNLPDLLTLPPPPPYEITTDDWATGNNSTTTSNSNTKFVYNESELSNDEAYAENAIDSVIESAGNLDEQKNQNDDDNGERDIADAFSFQSDNPDLPMSVIRATSPKLIAVSASAAGSPKLMSADNSSRLQHDVSGIIPRSPVLPTGEIPAISIDDSIDDEPFNHTAGVSSLTSHNKQNDNSNANSKINQPVLSPDGSADFHSFSSSNSSDDEHNKDTDDDLTNSDNDNDVIPRMMNVPGVLTGDDQLPLLLTKSLTTEAEESLQKLKLTTHDNSIDDLPGHGNDKSENLKINFWSPINSPSRYNHNSDSGEDIDISDLNPL